ncbi:hypothetical protein PVAP13_6NG094903 [Panicum virgatum]|uniref:Uncharacterized protein n=1 Tax=Panicum virgatum TaxID=38727 RepID=A0A8T0QWP5_PANVG|nr:hypothetical protein PVAP13_6NG094903 [Panicum virgatum]
MVSRNWLAQALRQARDKEGKFCHADGGRTRLADERRASPSSAAVWGRRAAGRGRLHRGFKMAARAGGSAALPPRRQATMVGLLGQTVVKEPAMSAAKLCTPT